MWSETRTVAEHNGATRGNRASQGIQAKQGKMIICIFKVRNVYRSRPNSTTKIGKNLIDGVLVVRRVGSVAYVIEMFERGLGFMRLTLDCEQLHATSGMAIIGDRIVNTYSPNFGHALQGGQGSRNQILTIVL